jgi:hypothetical protein
MDLYLVFFLSHDELLDVHKIDELLSSGIQLNLVQQDLKFNNIACHPRDHINLDIDILYDWEKFLAFQK